MTDTIDDLTEEQKAILNLTFEERLAHYRAWYDETYETLRKLLAEASEYHYEERTNILLDTLALIRDLYMAKNAVAVIYEVLKKEPKFDTEDDVMEELLDYIKHADWIPEIHRTLPMLNIIRKEAESNYTFSRTTFLKEIKSHGLEKYVTVTPTDLFNFDININIDLLPNR